jgi:hypothetical protein
LKTPEQRSKAGRALALLRKPVAHECHVCGGAYTSVDVKALYCSKACACRAYRARRLKREQRSKRT